MNKILWPTVVLAGVLISGYLGYSYIQIRKGQFMQDRVSIESQDNLTNNIENKVFNKTSKQYAIMAREAWSAFQCSIWASQKDDHKETERLFYFGYEKGKEFIGALEAKKINEEDAKREVPIGFSMSLSGPTPDFALGTIYSAATDDAYKATEADISDPNWEAIKKTNAMHKYQDSNCMLLVD